MRILIIEDDAKIASFLEKGLKEAGFTVDSRGDGQAGLELALSVSYDAAIVDLMLPKLDGLAVIETMRSENVDTPVLSSVPGNRSMTAFRGCSGAATII